jgi:hypothetical protein
MENHDYFCDGSIHKENSNLLFDKALTEQARMMKAHLQNTHQIHQHQPQKQIFPGSIVSSLEFDESRTIPLNTSENLRFYFQY